MGTNVFYFLAQEADGSEVSMDAEQKMDGIRPIQNKVCNMNTPLYVCMLDIFFSSNHNIHKSSCGLCFWASDLLTIDFSKIYQLKGLNSRSVVYDQDGLYRVIDGQ